MAKSTLKNPSTLPIALPSGNPVTWRIIEVPCEIPDGFSVDVFLPSRGVRAVNVWLSSDDARTASIKDIALSGKEGDPRGPNGYELDEDEHRRADEAASDVLEALLTRLSMNPHTSAPIQHLPKTPHAATVHAIAQAFEVECIAFDANLTAFRSLNGNALAPFYEGDPRTDTNSLGWASRAARTLEKYVEQVLDEVKVAQSEKAHLQLSEHPPARGEEEDEPGSERIRSERTLDVATLKCLYPDVAY